MPRSGRLASALLSILMFALFLAIWQVATRPGGGEQAADTEYAKMLGSAAASGQKSAMPSPKDVGLKMWEHVKDPFYVRGTNDQGIGIQIAYSIGRVMLGFGLAALVAIPLGFLIGMSPLLYRAFDPFIQVLKPISPLAWMPLALYTIKDSATSSIFVIFICSLWPMLINTAFGVSAVRREWLNVARTLEVSPMRKAFQVVLPAAAPTIMTGMRIAVGFGWTTLVAAEMVAATVGLGQMVLNASNFLRTDVVIMGIVVIGVVAYLFDLLMRYVERVVVPWKGKI